MDKQAKSERIRAAVQKAFEKAAGRPHQPLAPLPEGKTYPIETLRQQLK